MTTHDPDFLADYEALSKTAGLVDFSDRTLIEIAGDDRAQFLHNLCTNEIRKLPPGAGCETFLTNVQGKIVAHVLVFSGPDSLVLETVPEQADKILAHLDRYLIREKVELRNRSLHWSQWLLAGPNSESLLAGLTGGSCPHDLWASQKVQIDGHEVWLRRVDVAGPIGFLLDCRRTDADKLGEVLVQAGARRAGGQALEAKRIEAGFPFYGPDISDKNLPQELARDDRTISFTKGCYLGQETVARIDALGHVNQTLVGVRFAGPVAVSHDLELTAAGTVVGRVTSAALSPALHATLALAYVRRGSNQPGTRLESAEGPAEVVALPIAPASV
jgi:tRNA-modifying protein YgfZ